MRYKRLKRPYNRQSGLGYNGMILSLDDPRVQRLIDRNIYDNYVRKQYAEEGGDVDE